jgi:hypothetical protein
VGAFSYTRALVISADALFNDRRDQIHRLGCAPCLAASRCGLLLALTKPPVAATKMREAA